MRAEEIIRHAAAFAGSTTGRQRLLRDFLVDYVEWGVQEILKRMSSRSKHFPFLYSVGTLDLAVLGDSGDYELPSDFYKEISVWGLGDGDAKYKIDGVPTDSFFNLERERTNRTSYTTYFLESSQRWRIRFKLPSGMTVTSYEFAYRRGQARIQGPGDILIFPSNRGWEQVVIYAAMKNAYRLMQEDMAFDPAAEFERLLELQIAGENAEAPDEQRAAPLSEAHLWYKRWEGEP